MSTMATPATNQAKDPRKWLILAVMSLGTLIVFLDLTVVNTALPSIARDLSASTAELQWVVDSYVLVLAGLLILAGSIGDRFGRRKSMFVGLLLFLVGSVVGALSDTSTILITGRAIQGLGAAFVLPATLSIITNTFERDERNKAIAVWTAVGGMGIGFGPAVGGYLVDRYEWSAAFWVHVPVILAVIIGLIVVPESQDSRKIGLDIPGAITATAGISILVFGIIQGTEEGWTSPLIIGSFIAAGALLFSFVAIERRTKYPMLPLRFFAEKDFTGSVAVIGLAFFAGPSMFFFLTQFFQIIQGRDAFEAGLLILPNAGTIVLASAIAPKMETKVGLRNTVLVGSAIMTVSIFGFSQIELDWSATTSASLIALLGFGFGLILPSLTDSVMTAVPVEDAGVGSAINDVSRELGSALGIAILGSFINSLYRSNIDTRLEGKVDDQVIEISQEGIGVVAGSLEQLPPEVGGLAFTEASEAFVEALNTGLYLNAAVMACTLGIAVLLLPSRARTTQATRSTDEANTPAAVDA